jgi:protein-L-isoaspartate(D-aspartate) O-methyltransferase
VNDQIEARQAMISGQLLPNQITDERVIAALTSVSRDLFVPKALKGVAYVDEDIEVAPGRFVMEPMVLAKLISAANIQKTDFVLEVGCATGYSSAVLSKLADAVVAVEEDEELSTKAYGHLQDCGADNVAVVCCANSEGVIKQGPFQVIFINGGVEEIPQTLIDQLADGGRMVFVRLKNGVGHGHMLTKNSATVDGRDLFDANVDILPGFNKKAQFVF